MANTLPVDASKAVPRAAQSDDPSVPSSDYSHDVKFWKMASDILAGTEAMRAVSHDGSVGGSARQFENVPTQRFAALRGVEAQSPYLPKFPNEPWDEYNRRRENAFFTNIYGDISHNLSSKPFSKTCELEEGTSPEVVKASENIDGLGNNLHVFARDVFKTAVDKGITWILCDYTKVPPGSTLEAERNMGARAYWVHVPAEKLIAVYSKFLHGKEIIFHARIDEKTVELDGYEEKTVNRVRELNREPIVDAQDNITGFAPATWTVYQENVEKDKKTGKETTSWEEVDSGDITIGVIPLVPIILGKRDGTSWRVSPPLRDLAYMQVKLFQMESNIDAIKELCAFPMLTGNGITGVDDKGQTIKVPVGPRAVLFAPMAGDGSHGQWNYIEPAGSSTAFLETSIEKHKTEMRDLGMQPLTASNLTVVTTTNVAAKAHNAVQAWALMAKDALEQAYKITMMWSKQTAEPVVKIHTDFGVSLTAEQDFSTLTSAQGAGILSPETVREEFKRRGLLSDEFTEERELERLANHEATQVLLPEKQIDPVTGMPIVVSPQPGVLNPPPKPPIKVRPGERIIN